MPKALVVTSGGMDSTTALYLAIMQGHEVETVSFDYGQKHSIELQKARTISHVLDIEHHLVPLPKWSLNTALTSNDVDVPEGHYANETMKQTVVPNRNSIMLNVAAGLAIDLKAELIYTGVHAGDHPVYPDCRPKFITALNGLLSIANEGFNPPVVVAPFIDVEKVDIARIGTQLDVPFHHTWSCYKGGVLVEGRMIHCGRCSTCVERLEAMYLASVDDKTPYHDSFYWKTVADG